MVKTASGINSAPVPCPGDVGKRLSATKVSVPMPAVSMVSAPVAEMFIPAMRSVLPWELIVLLLPKMMLLLGAEIVSAVLVIVLLSPKAISAVVPEDCT